MSDRREAGFPRWVNKAPAETRGGLRSLVPASALTMIDRVAPRAIAPSSWNVVERAGRSPRDCACNGSCAGGGLRNRAALRVAIPIEARSFAVEGVGHCRVAFQKTGDVKTVMAAIFTYGGRLAGRQSRSRPLLDYDVQGYDKVLDGTCAALHPECHSVIKDFRAPRLGKFDVRTSGAILSRKCAAMRLTNIAGAGEAIRAFKAG